VMVTVTVLTGLMRQTVVRLSISAVEDISACRWQFCISKCHGVCFLKAVFSQNCPKVTVLKMDKSGSVSQKYSQFHRVIF